MNKKKSVKKSLSLLLLMLFCSFFAKGQETSEPGNLNSLKFLKNEKFHIPAKTLREAYFNKDKLKKHKDYNFTGKNEAILGDRDGVISNEQLPESEIHAAINPKDSSNIIVSFMRQNPIDFTNPLEIPLYYTKDFGKSWKQSSFVCQPHIDGAFISGGGDPIISYDGSGKAYLTWIYTFLTFDSVYA